MIWIITSILILLVLFGIVLSIIAFKSKKKLEPDYYTLFIMGLLWLPIGIIEMAREGFSIFFMLGLVFFLTGIINKDKWKKNHVNLNDMPSKQKKIAIIVTFLLGLLVFAAFVIYYFIK